MIYTTRYASPVGSLTLASDGDSLVGLWIEGQKYFAATLPGNVGDAGDVAEKSDPPVFAMVTRWLDAYFAGKNPPLKALPLSPAGSAFRKTVWDMLCDIPYGQYATYGEIAQKTTARTGRRASARAVGGAVGHNPISIIIPCHRVVGAGGNLTGYAGGVSVKLALLEREGVDTAAFFIPATSIRKPSCGP